MSRIRWWVERSYGIVKAMDALKEDHALIERALSVLERAVSKIEQGWLPDLALLQQLRSFFVDFADHAHHRKEEDVLFPILEEQGMPREGGPIGVMLREHEQGRSLVAVLGGEDQAAIVRAGKDYVHLLKLHIQKENQILFPMAEQILAAGAQERVEAQFQELEREHPHQRQQAEDLVAKLERELES